MIYIGTEPYAFTSLINWIGFYCEGGSTKEDCRLYPRNFGVIYNLMRLVYLLSPHTDNTTTFPFPGFSATARRALRSHADRQLRTVPNSTLFPHTCARGRVYINIETVLAFSKCRKRLLDPREGQHLAERWW